MNLPTPHLEKLNAVLVNDKLPRSEAPRIREAMDRYSQWIAELNALMRDPPSDLLQKMVKSVNDYKDYIDIDLIFDSENDFLYRQKGQLKLDNSIIEEFLPWLTQPPLVAKLD